MFAINRNQLIRPVQDFFYAEQSVPVEVVPDDTTARFPVKKTRIAGHEDLNTSHPIDLRNPSNIIDVVEYDPEIKLYVFKTRVGEGEWITTLTMTPDEYNDYIINKSMASFFKSKYDAEREKEDEGKDDFSLKDIKISLGPAERIFGPGGVQIKTQGYIEASMGLNYSSSNNPTRPVNKRKRTMFDFDQKIQMNVKASVGDKVSFDMNYDTEATFDFDSKKIKLAYEGKEDEILKRLEAGNVSMATTNSLVNGGASLFGIRADLQFGKLRISSVISQQETQSKSVNSKGGVQTTPFEFKADQYDENRHFFLGYYFRDHYDEAMSTLPFVKSPVNITRMEVWVTNRRGDYNQARNIVAFTDLAEADTSKIYNNTWKYLNIKAPFPANDANELYTTMLTNYASIRNISQVTEVLSNFQSGMDYEKVENARLLSSTEYSFDPQTGYISLRNALQPNDVLAIAYEYTARGVRYQVGEFSSDILDQYDPANPKSGALFVKLLKPVSSSPESKTWHLMMKNVYSLGAYSLQSDKFRLNISYLNDSVGTYTNYINEGNIKETVLLRVMRLDSLDSRNNRNPDGIFDYIEGKTVNSSMGRVIFPVVEPFGSHLAKKINNPSIAEKYVYQELYDSTLTVARQNAEKNKFKISGSYRATSSSEIDLGAMNVARGSVVVKAGGVVLVENSDYTVDYAAGRLTILNQQYSASDISVTLEDQSLFSMQKKTMLGLNLSYDFSKNFTIGGTIMHMYEKPLTMKTEIGNEALKNTLWGLNTSYRTESQWLTNLVDKLPFYNATAPSAIAFTGEFAHLIPGHYENKYGGGYSYLDDFESSQSSFSLLSPTNWYLASTPSYFQESKNMSLEYGMNRAHMAWFSIDRIFTRKNSPTKPEHITPDDLSNHFVREVYMTEIYPNRDISYSYNEAATLTTMNISFYPEERGPYNLDRITPSTISKGLDLATGKLRDPRSRWGGMMQKITNTDFEANNVEYIEFWLMDPFWENDGNQGGELYINLGDVSEDILKDGRKFYENGMPLDGDTTAYENSIWGHVPKRQSTVYAFDNTSAGEANRHLQDVGYNGLNTEQEKEFGTYKDYIQHLMNGLDPTVRDKWLSDQFSPFNDPAGDNFHYFRGPDYDSQQLGILDRYKKFNGTEGNSTPSKSGEEIQSSTNQPDVEDINGDNTMNETESYYQYKIELKPDKMKVGAGNYIVEEREVTVPLRNGHDGKVTWYLFKVPVNTPEKERIGTINNFKNINYIRMFLTDFAQTTYLRFATLALVRGDWRVYTNSLSDKTSGSETSISTTTVNIEENSNKQPVNYVMPPGVTRIADPSQPQLTKQNEQAMSMRIENLVPDDARAVYKNTMYDLRRFKRLQMFSHAEALMDGTALGNGDFSVFLRLGSDYKNNYYEYEIPLTVTPHGEYRDTSDDRLAVWPESNMFDFPLELLKNIKLNRNKKKRQAGSDITLLTPYSEVDPEKVNNKVTVMGNPSLAEVTVVMIGIRNNSKSTHSGEIWINELRLTDFEEKGGWAAQGSMIVNLSDLATLNVSGHKETVGFGSLDQSLMERRDDDLSTYNISTSIDVGKLLPEQAKMSIPFYYSYSNHTTTPQYDPLDQDVTMDEALSVVDTKAEKDSIKNLAQDKYIVKNISINNARINVKSKTPMPYDPANFNFTYTFNETYLSNPTTEYDVTKDYQGAINYSYSPTVKPWEPFKNIKSKAPATKFAKSLSFNYLPNNISFNTSVLRNYNETVLRDLEGYMLGGNNNQNKFLSFSKDFYWNRDFSLTWDFTKNLKFSFQSGTQAEIEEPWSVVNKKLYPEEYDVWKEEVIKSIRNLGTPYTYNQTAKVTYNFPFAVIPILDWINTSANYDSRYGWNRGAETNVQDFEIGNTINNSATFTLNGRFNMMTLYNKWEFLKKVNQKFEGSGNRRGTSTPRQNVKDNIDDNKRKFEQTVKIEPEKETVVRHNLNSKKVRVTARRTDNSRIYPIKFKSLDENSIRINKLKDSVELKFTVLREPESGDPVWYKAAQYTARGLMSLRSLSVTYSNRNETYIYGYREDIGDVFGQKRRDGAWLPGLGFAFGLDGGEDYVRSLVMRDDPLLIMQTDNIYPAIITSANQLNIKAQLEPIKGLKIDLSALHEESKRTELQYMFDGMPRTLGGSFAMTTITLTTSLRMSSADNNYASETFDKFRNYRDIIASRMTNEYNGVEFPSSSGSKPTIGEVNKNSADVLIPAFIAAYTGKDVNSIKLTPFPSASSLLPNWTVSYDGLLDLIPALKKKVKSVRLSHGYTSQYRIGSYNSYSGWIGYNDQLGFIPDAIDNNVYEPSSPYNISSVSLTEAFNPLFGAESTLNNNMTLRVRYNNSRSLSLNISSYQIIETLRNEFVLGFGYRITNFNRIIGIKDKNVRGFSNDLNLSADISYSKGQSLIRKIQDGYSQATSGSSIFSIKFAADYNLSKALTLKVFYDRVGNTPLMSSASYPTTNANFGISLRFTLTQ